MTVSTLRWPLFAVLGLLVAIAIAVLATQMVSEKIGITSEPVTAGESLSPAHTEGKRSGHAKSDGREHAGTGTSTAGSDGSGPVGGLELRRLSGIG